MNDLATEITELRRAYSHMAANKAQSDIAAQTFAAEAERYKQALEDIADRSVCYDARVMARKALQP